jgi:acetate kinase
VTSRPEPRVLTVNAGSSSLKIALYPPGDPPRRTYSARVDRLGLPGTRLLVNEEAPRNIQAPDVSAAFELAIGQADEIAAIGHRIVHGGPKHDRTARIDAEMLTELRRISPFDPEHLPAQIALIEVLRLRFPGVPQVACFDTAFHRDLPPVSRVLPIPRKYEALGVRKYGFHGLSYSYLLGELGRVAGVSAARGRVVIAHLGNGASLAAVKDGRCIDTTMSFTPASGIPMSRRSGDLDPGLVSFLARVEGMTPDRFQTLVNTESGLLGISETSPDVRDLLERESSDPRAALALEIFCYHVRKSVGAFAAALGGLETLVFAGGIGENSAILRERICRGLEFLGLAVDSAANATHAALLSRQGSQVAVRMIRTDEESEIARSTWEMLSPARRLRRPR